MRQERVQTIFADPVGEKAMMLLRAHDRQVALMTRAQERRKAS